MVDSASKARAELPINADLPERVPFDAGASRRAWIALAVVFAIYNVSFRAFRWLLVNLVPVDWPPTTVGIFGLFFAQPTLLAVWLALGCDRFAARLRFVVRVYVALVIALVGVPMARDPLFIVYASHELVQFYLREIAFMVSLALSLSFLRAVYGWKLVGVEYSGELPPGKRVRFGLRHMFIVMTVVAVWAALIARRWQIESAITFTIGLASAPLIAATLVVFLPATRTRIATLTGLAIIVACNMALVAAGLFARQPQPWVVTAEIWYIGVLLSLLWLRKCGWRLAWPK